MVDARPRPIESHSVHMDRLMEHAWEQLEKGDRLQASEKGWGAVVHALKGIARRRGWPHRTHSHNAVIAAHLSDVSGDDLIFLLYQAAQTMHVNYYEDTMREPEIRRFLLGVADLLQRLAAADDRVGPDAPAPAYPRSRRRT